MKPYYEQDGVTIYHGDCRVLLPLLSADAVVTDPPYGLGERLRSGAAGEWSAHFEEAPSWDREIASPELVCGLERFAKAVIWGGNYYPLTPARGWLIWDKKQEHSSGHCELAWTNLDIPTRIFRLSRVEAYSSGKLHPTEKPVALMTWCLALASIDGVVVDPFMGSGSTLRAAKDAGLSAIGIEREERYCEIAAKRLAQGVLPLRA